MQKCRDVYKRQEEAYANLLRNQRVVTAELLKTTVSGANSVPEYLLQAGAVERERLRVRSKEINSTSTYRQSKTTQLNLRQFIESRGMKEDVYKRQPLFVLLAPKSCGQPLKAPSVS